MLWTILPLVIVLAAVAYLTLTLGRARREHRARSEERAALLLAAMHGRGGEPKAEAATATPATAAGTAAIPAIATAVTATPATVAGTAAIPATVAGTAAIPATAAATIASAAAIAEPDAASAPALAALRRPRFLTDPQRLLYLILRSALPDHIVMANTRMIDLLDLPAGEEAVEHDPRLRELLHQRIDCVVCRNDLVPVAVLVVHAAAMPRAPDEQKRAETLREIGIKFLRFRADSLPRPAEMRTLVLG